MQSIEVGTQVEVTSSIIGFQNSWYKATIISPQKSNNITHQKFKNHWLWVEYDTVFDENDPLKKFQEFTDPLLIRPLPPKPDNCAKFEKYDFVDAYYKEGWFTGVVLDVMNDGLEYLVAFLHPYEEFVFEKDKIRVHFEWRGGGKWTKCYPSERVSVAFCTPNVGETVFAPVCETTPVVVSPVELGHSPSKKLKQATIGDAEGRPSSDQSDAVQSQDAPQKFLQPSPLTSREGDNAPGKFLQPCPLISSEGDIHCSGKRKAIDGQNYFTFLSSNSEGFKGNDVIFPDSHSSSHVKGNRVIEMVDLTDELEEVIDEQVISPAEQIIKKLKQTTSGNSERRPSPYWKIAAQSKDPPQNFLQPCPLTSSKGDTHSGRRKASDGQNCSSSIPDNLSRTALEGIEKNGDSHTRSLAKGNQVTKEVDLINVPEKVIYEQGDCRSKALVSCAEPASTECLEACPRTTCYSSPSDYSQSWPFTKKSSMWDVIESMEVFKKVPMPHFSPLNEHEEMTREILAINMMMKFSYEVDRISAGSVDAVGSPEVIQDTLKSLKELESHGFNTIPLQVHLNKLLVKMDEEEKLKGNLEEVESRIRKCQDEKTKLDRKVTNLAEQMKSLQKQIRTEKSVKDLKDMQLANLESQKDIMSRKLHDFQLSNELLFEW